MKNPCRECVGHCTGTSKENCWQWIGYDRDRLARRVAKLETKEAAAIAKRGAK